MKIKRLFALSLLIAIVGGTWAQPMQTKGNRFRNRDAVSLPYSCGFEVYEQGGIEVNEFDDWELISENSVTGQYVVDGTYPSHSASHGFKFHTGSGSDTESQYLISPELSGTDGNALEVQFFYVNFDVESREVFQVGYSTKTESDIDDFVWEDEIVADEHNSSGWPDWPDYNVSFPIGVKYIAIKCFPGGNALLLDDFNFSLSDETCAKPSAPTVSNLTYNSVSLSWTGNSDSYELKYGKKVSYTFDKRFDGWTHYDKDHDGFDWGLSDEFGHASTGIAYSLSYEVNPLNPDNYLVSPQLQLGGVLTFYARGHSLEGFWEEHFGVFVSTEDEVNVESLEDDFELVEYDDFTEGFTTTNMWTKYVVDLSSYEGETGYVAIRHYDSPEMDQLQVDDITYMWDEISVENLTEKSYLLQGLEDGTDYYVQVQGSCDVDYWSAPAYFTTPAREVKSFTNATEDGKWGTAGNWQPSGVPSVEQNVLLSANATIENGCVAEAYSITQGNYNLTIADGGQLKHNNEGVVVTLQKGIVGYTVEQGTTEIPTNGWYLLSFPVKVWDAEGELYLAIEPDQVDNLLEDTYDLYKFNPWNGGGEWINYKGGNNSLFESPIITDGYLYATDRENVTLEITGVVNSMNQTDEQIVVLTKNPDNANYGSWNLVGNPQVYEVYPIVVHLVGEQYVDDEAKPYYRMNDGQELILGEGAIHPLEGVFMQCDGDGAEQTVRFSATPYEAPDLATTQGGITLNLTKEQNKVIDRAMVRFGEGSLMGKLMLNPNNTHICIPQSGKEYAVVRGEGEGELPVNFKAAENGIYTLTAEVNDADMDYLRLIDNLTGANVDLLRQPSYSFEAATTDYASRFKLVFSASDNNNASSTSIFAFFNGSNWTVNNTGEATLQVIDVLGRVVSTETINGDAEINLSQSEGVYMLRLVNSDSVKVQKVVVR